MSSEIYSGNQSKSINMYKSELITRPDGSKYVRCIRIPEPETRSIEELKDMKQISRAIEAFGTSS